MKKRIVNLKNGLEEWLKSRLERLSPQARKLIVLMMLALFAILSLYTFGKAMYDIGRESNRLEIEHIKQPFIQNGKRSINRLNNNYNGTERRTEQESGNFPTDGRTEEGEAALD